MNLWKNHKMNLRCKIKYWLIKKLGGIPKSEVSTSFFNSKIKQISTISGIVPGITDDVQNPDYCDFIKRHIATEIGNILVDSNCVSYSYDIDWGYPTAVIRFECDVLPSNGTRLEDILSELSTQFT